MEIEYGVLFKNKCGLWPENGSKVTYYIDSLFLYTVYGLRVHEDEYYEIAMWLCKRVRLK